MKKSRFTDSQIMAILKQAESGATIEGQSLLLSHHLGQVSLSHGNPVLPYPADHPERPNS